MDRRNGITTLTHCDSCVYIHSIYHTFTKQSFGEFTLRD